jgi:hypothetical protein
MFHEERVRLVPGSDAHDASAIARWTTVQLTLAPLLGAAPHAGGRTSTGLEAPLVT